MGSPDQAPTCFDRWIVRNIYGAGLKGMGFECGGEMGTEFTAVVEDCVGVRRFAGGFVMGFVGRKDEPVTFRRCYFMCLDWWGDAAGFYVRAENPTMRDFPDVVFEDCTLVGPDNAMQAGNPGFEGRTRVKMAGCRLVALNFSIPEGQPSTGIMPRRDLRGLHHGRPGQCPAGRQPGLRRV